MAKRDNMASSHIKLIASDLDGTLLAPDGQLSDRTIAAIGAADEAGIEVIAATGRSRHSAMPRLRPCPAVRTAVCSNGAVVFDAVADRVRLHRSIALAEVVAAMDHLRAVLPDVGFGMETPEGFGFDESFLAANHAFDERGNTPTDLPLDSTEVTKLFISVAGLTGVELQQRITPVLPATLTASTSGAAFVEATAAGVDKATTVALLAADRGLGPEHVMAFGDQMNDVPLLRWAGSSCAMGNARPEAQAVADRTIARNGDDGVARIIESLVT